LTEEPGDEDLRSRLEDLSNASVIINYTFPSSLVFAATAVATAVERAPSTASITTPVQAAKLPTTTRSSPELHNPLEGEPDAWQLNESFDAFLDRLRPSAPAAQYVGPWIWVANPRPAAHRTATADLVTMHSNGMRLLEDYDTLRLQIEKEMLGKAKGAITRKLTPKRNALPDAIAKIAIEANCTSGKWMLFPQMSEVDATWRAVVQATVGGRLGPMAKVATAGDDPTSRLICVYTKDFNNQRDVRRVLIELMNMGLARGDRAARGIWYKSDVYTHLGILSGNEYGIKASIYGSTKMLQEDA